MANFELKFIDCYKDTTITVNKKTDSIYTIDRDCIFIVIEEPKTKESFSIRLDKSTAIKFAKTLRTEINKITESEVKNG